MKYIIHSGPGLGDMIQTSTMAKAIKDNDRDAVVDFLITGSKEIHDLDVQILSCHDYVRYLHWYSIHSPLHDIKLLMQLKKEKYDIGIVFAPTVTRSRKHMWKYRIMRMSGCSKIIGAGTDKVDVEVKIPPRAHYLERNRLILSAIQIPAKIDPKCIDSSKLDLLWARGLCKTACPVVSISLGTNPMIWKDGGEAIRYDVKSWGYNNWAKLIERLSYTSCLVILLGGNKEKYEIEGQGIVLPKSSNVINMVGQTTVKQSLALLAISNLVIGGEGGIMHCAAGIGTRTLTLFGGTDHMMWNPGGPNGDIIRVDTECAPCFCTRQAAYCKDHKCLEGITVDMVFERVKGLLGI